MKPIYLRVLLVIMSCHLSFASAMVADSDPSLPLFATELEAVLAASNSFNPRSILEDREYMGTIFRCGGKFGYTVSAGAQGADRVSISVASSAWNDVVAFWHTHGDAAPNHRYFSDVDTRTVKRTGKPFYLADYTGLLKVFRTGSRTLTRYAAERFGLPSRSGYGVGELVKDSANRSIRVSTKSDGNPSDNPLRS